MSDKVFSWSGSCSWSLRPGIRNRRWVGNKGCLFTMTGPGVEVVWQYRKFKGMAILAVARLAKRGRPEQLLRREEFPSMKKRVPASEKPTCRHLAAMETEMFKDAMPLVEHCALMQYDEGDGRKTGKFFVETVGPAWKVTVKDVDTCTQFSVVADRLDKAFEAAALLLACEDAPWEPDVWALEKAKQKKR